ncbi:acetyl-CoA C-acyltransferase [Bacillus cereus]|uniref:acetyl-CoA C-acetyltransferase n=1 Tax=Bacillus sp. AFS023182 TaxID=2033492 RepID=UPI000BF5B001|nr:acetyl-CoA C-acetyltransferase [Bacillus sp. AFS023182]PFE02910.1 acetyl-CoA C-acyltransferase [Bacillus sp. AFS023182]PGX92453.1 acetyl-CoA C-acyltransferase [Bacillus cereus]
MSKTDVVLVEGARTPLAEFCGSFRDVSAIDLGAIASKEAIKKANVNPEEIDQVVFGNVQQSSRDAHYLARHVGLKAGLSIHVPALTVNRLCGSGLESILTAARYILTGEANMVLAGGAENMSQVPHVIRGMRWGSPLGSPTMEDWVWDGLYDTYGDCTMAVTAENLAKKYKLSREEIDEYAFLSHQKALAAMEKGYFKEEIIPVTVKDKKGSKIIDTDEHPRNTSIEQLSKLKARFIEGGVITPGNASGMNDAGAAVVLASEEYAIKKGLKPLARLVSWDVVGVEPELMGIGPAPAIRGALRKASLKLEDLDLIEINEAFSAQYLACQKELGFNPEIGNVNGGAVALGHPLAVSGTRISLSLIYELDRRGKKYGASSVCIGGGQGIAAIWERL